ncbi:peptidoglycan DD-metalloendopeptidase family protein [Methylopila sp. M107]|uniref:peptidoglycan DD-metalloendopeptidase family protein n=1 Tax=Methylopila sp. M107 TaxID=1101190 RepID=UPI0003AA9B16|nr:peptidoglycan DD-metalloendopeptidase family protein [Methylopila sp. M107]
MVRVAAVALASGSVAACSSDSTRFGEDPFSNPFSSASASDPAPHRPRREVQPEGDIPTGAVRAAPASRVERSPLGAPSSAQSRPMYGYGSNSGGEAHRSSRYEPQATGSVRTPRPAQVASADPNWSSSGGTMVTLGRGETVQTISTRYGVPANAIMRANGLSSADAVGEGRQILIPVYSASPSGYRVATAEPRAIESRPVEVRANEVPRYEPRPFGVRADVAAPRAEIAAPRVAVVAPRVAVAQPVAPRAEVAAHVPAAPGKPKMQFISGPQPRGAEFKSAEVRAPEVRAPEVRAQIKAPEARAQINAPEVKAPEVKAKVAAAPLKPAQSEQAFAAAPVKAQLPSNDDNVKTAALKVDPAPAAEPTGPSFRWPARGRVISAYGSKSSGSKNDGVNIAVPEGTEVKASDDGVVAYSGSELKGFGNLVLIRHSNGWVTAYAHNSALNVKRGETVRRGQIIAKSGSTGSVTSPQLHFEVRKGAQTVDPIKHLPDA